MKKDNFAKLETKYEADLLSGEPYRMYPRMQLRRDSFISLNGEWSFKTVTAAKEGYSGKILVPFPPESRISGVGRSVGDLEKMIYTRDFSLDVEDGYRVLLHIGACDRECRVLINGKLAATGNDGYLPIDSDITEYVQSGKNRILIEARDTTDTEYPYGKQKKKRGGMWYTKTSGIWQSVWLECVPDKYIEGLRITPSLDGCDIEVRGGEEEKLLILMGKEYRFTGSRIRIDIDEPHLWTPEDPYLYDFSLISGKDRVESYFGLRTVAIEGTDILLNGKRIFFSGLLDQGYYSDGIFCPASEQGYLDDVISMRSLGFNMLRKHIKLEPDVFYYFCDKYGMAVFQDMINSGRYSFIIDTALPTAFLKRGVKHGASRVRKAAFLSAGEKMQDLLYNHPSVLLYTIFNEGWGQHDEKRYYAHFKARDNTRIYDTASGWFKVEETDVDSDHVYFKRIKAKRPVKRPLILSEFGGFACSVKGHIFNPSKTYGYSKYESAAEFEAALSDLYENELIPAARAGLCAAVLTQVSDVEDETNGLLTYDRAVLKVTEEKMKRINEKLYAAFLSP